MSSSDSHNDGDFGSTEEHTMEAPEKESVVM